MFIAFEGIDGSGKTVISKAFAESRGFLWTKEPMFDSDEADKLNELPMADEHREATFLIDRVQHQSVIQEMLVDHDVVCDRYLWSALVYSSVFSPEVYEFLLSVYTQPFFRIPDCFVFVDTPAKTCAVRRPGRSSDAEKTLKSLEKLERAYHDVHPNHILEWENIPVIDVSGQGTVEQAITKLSSLLKLEQNSQQLNLFK